MSSSSSKNVEYNAWVLYMDLRREGTEEVAMEDGGQAYYFITTIITEERNLSTRVWALPLACAKLGGGAPISYHHNFYYLYLS